jgi:hypothetical protein
MVSQIYGLFRINGIASKLPVLMGRCGTEMRVEFCRFDRLTVELLEHISKSLNIHIVKVYQTYQRSPSSKGECIRGNVYPEPALFSLIRMATRNPTEAVAIENCTSALSRIAKLLNCNCACEFWLQQSRCKDGAFSSSRSDGLYNRIYARI